MGSRVPFDELLDELRNDFVSRWSLPLGGLKLHALGQWIAFRTSIGSLWSMYKSSALVEEDVRSGVATVYHVLLSGMGQAVPPWEELRQSPFVSRIVKFIVETEVRR